MSASTYNGLPTFEVGFSDFLYVSVCKSDPSKRLLSKNIEDDELREFYMKSRKPRFAVTCDGMTVTYGST